VAAFVGGSEAADAFGVAGSDVCVAVGAVIVVVALTRTVDHASVINTSFTVHVGCSVTSVTS